jgi:hypothetical protein
MNNEKPLTPLAEFDAGVTLNADGSAYVRFLDLTRVRAALVDREKLQAEHDQIFALLPATTNGDSDNVGGVRGLVEDLTRLRGVIKEAERSGEANGWVVCPWCDALRERDPHCAR